MSEIRSSIRIEDGFTEPLRELAKASWDVDSAVTAVAKSLVEQGKEMESIAEESKKLGKSFAEHFGDHLELNIERTAAATKALLDTTKHAFTDFYALSSGVGMKMAANMTAWSFIGPIKDLKKESKILLEKSYWGALASLRWNTINKMSMAAFNKMRDSYLRGFRALMASLDKSMDEINITDKLNAAFGAAGNVARDRAYELANELGESATTVSELAARAGYEGIGTAHFERMMKLADKVGKLKPGETTESAASNLMSNIKSGHDASSLAQMFGGGEKMERQLRYAGYERALNRGDLDKALDIAEKIAEQAGLTDEKYQNATNNLSNNYKKIMNTLDNVQRRLAESFNRTFGPTVKKIKELFESQKFKNFVDIADFIVTKVGKFLNWFAETAVDNIQVIGIMLGVGIVSKVMFLLPKIALILKMLAISKGPIGWIIRGLGTIIGKLVTIIAKHGALHAIKVAGPWVAAGAAIAGATYGIYKLSGTTKSFTGWLKGVLAAGYQGAMNFFTNVFIFFDRLPTKIKQFGLILKNGVFTIIGTIKSKVGELLTWLIDTLFEFINGSILGDLLDKLGVDAKSLEASLKSSVSDFGASEFRETDEIAKQIAALEEHQMQYIDMTAGMTEAFESEGATMIAHLKELVGIGKRQEDAQKGIETDTGKIRRMGEQEEELRWLKAFSDRQIMSSYSSSTSNSRTINLNGVSQNTMAEAYRRNRSTIPARAKT